MNGINRKKKEIGITTTILVMMTWKKKTVIITN